MDERIEKEQIFFPFFVQGFYLDTHSVALLNEIEEVSRQKWAINLWCDLVRRNVRKKMDDDGVAERDGPLVSNVARNPVITTQRLIYVME